MPRMRAIAVAVAVIAAGAASASGQAMFSGRIGLYVNENRAGNTVLYSGSPTEFTLYTFVLPGTDGMMAAEFAVSYPANVVPGYATPNSGVAAVLGDLASGVSVTYGGCQVDWAWTHRQQVFLMDTATAWIEPVAHGTSGAMQIATCEAGYPLAPLTVCSSIGLNEEVPPDTVGPELLGAVCIAENAVELAFNEELLESSAGNIANYEIFEYGNPAAVVPVGTASLLYGGFTVRLDVAGFFFGGRTYVVRASGIRDIWGNEMVETGEASFVAVDVQPPQVVSAHAPNDSVIVAAFNEAVSPSSAEDPANYTLYNADGSPCASVPWSVELFAPDSVRLSFGEPKLPTLVQLTLRVWNIEDLAGNVISPLGNGVTLIVPDLYPPYLVWAYASSATLLDVQFNKAVTAATASDQGNYEIFAAADTLAGVPVIGVTVASPMRVKLSLGSGLAYDTVYVLRARNIEDPLGNRMATPDTIAFIRRDFDPPVALSAFALTTKLIEIAFNEPLDEASAEATNQYSLEPVPPLVPWVTIAAAELAASGDTVRLTLGTSIRYSTNYELRIMGVEDLRGNAMPATYFAISIPDTFPPNFIAVEATAPRTVRLTFDEILDITTAERESNYTLAESDNPARSIPIAEATLLLSRTFVQLTLGEDLVHERGYTLGVHDVSDVHGNVIEPGTSRSFTYFDVIPPALLAAAHIDTTSIMATFSEPLDTLTAQEPDNYCLFELLDPDRMLPVLSASLAGDSAYIRLMLAERLRMVEYRLRVNAVADRHGNVIAPNSAVSFAVSDTIPPLLLVAAAPAPRTVDLIFDERLAPAPALNTSNYILFPAGDTASAVAVTGAALLGDSTQVRLTLAEDLLGGNSYTVRLSGLTDIHGNVIEPGTSRSFTYFDVIPPALLSAAATSLTTVQVHFSEPLDPATAQATANYTVFESTLPSSTIAVAAATLMEDSSTVLLTLGSPFPQQGYGLRVTGVADRALNPVAPNSAVTISIPDFFPPALAQVSVETPSVVKIVFSEFVKNSAAENAANYRIIEQPADLDTLIPLSAALLPDLVTVRLALPAPLSLGQSYVLHVCSIEDLAGNPMTSCGEKDFVCPASFPSAGIGVYADLSHSATELRVAVELLYFVYVWARTGEQGLIGARFALSIPQGVQVFGVEWNPAYGVVGFVDLQTGIFQAALPACAGDWIWICRLYCRFNSSCLPLTIAVSEVQPPEGRVFWTCAPGNPGETPVILSSLRCAGTSLETLLENQSVAAGDGHVDITWRLSQIDEGIAFSVSRFEGNDSAPRPLGGAVSADGLSFSYRDVEVEAGKTYRYRVEYEDANGPHVLFETDPVTVPAAKIALGQNRPNPFNPTTTLDYFIPCDGHVALEIFDVAGRRITCLVNGWQKAGWRSAVWNGADDAGRPAAAGIYICRLTAGKESISRKMILLR